MEESAKLYKVTLRGMTVSVSDIAYGVSYVIAGNPSEAYDKVRKFLDDRCIGDRKDRELFLIELIADSYLYNNIGKLLHL